MTMAGMRDVRRARLAILGGVLAAGLALAACGGGSSHSASASTSGATTTTTAANAGARGGGAAALTAFTSCMSSHGVTITVPARTGNGNGTPPSTTPGETRPARGAGGGGGGFAGGFANRFNTPPAGVDPTKYKAALAACKSKLPTGGGGFQNSTAFQAYASCLKDHGVVLPARAGATGGGTTATTAPGTTSTTFNRSDPKVAAALKTCQPLLPAGGGFGGTTTTTAPSA